jgi:hypothetical protein
MKICFYAHPYKITIHSHSVISYSVQCSMSNCYSVFILWLLAKVIPYVCLIITKLFFGVAFHTLLFCSHVVSSQIYCFPKTVCMWSLRILPCISKHTLKYSQGITSRQIVLAVKENNLQIGILQRPQYFDFGNHDTVWSCRWNTHYRSTLCHNSEDCSLNTRHYENFDFCFIELLKNTVYVSFILYQSAVWYENWTWHTVWTFHHISCFGFCPKPELFVWIHMYVSVKSQHKP